MRHLMLGAVFFLTTIVSQAAPAQAASAPKDYRIRVGDTLSVTVFNEPTLTQPALRVLPGGNISMPLGREVHVGGLTSNEASRAVARSLSNYLRHPQVTVAVAIVGPVEVQVLGNVKQPGKYVLQPESHLTDAIASAGGLGPVDGELPTARLQAADGTVTEVSLQRLLQKGEVALNAPVSNQMTIYVPSPLAMIVQVFGAVDHPGDVTLHEGDRLLTAISRAGGNGNSNPDLNRVELRHVAADGKTNIQTVNLYEIYRSGDRTKDPVMQKGDIVFVPQAKKNVTSSVLSTLFNFGLGRVIP